MTFANRMDPDHAQQSLGPDLDPICFEKDDFEKKQRRQPKGMPNYPIGVRSGSALFGFNPQKGY